MIAGSLTIEKYEISRHRGAGYIGSHIVCELNARTEHEVVVVDTMEKGSEVNLFPKNEFIQGDIADNTILKKIFSKK